MIKSRLDTTEKICEPEDTAIETIQNDKHGGKEDKKIMNRESIMTERTVSSVLTYVYVCPRMGREAQKTVKAMAEKFPKLIKNINLWIKEHQQNPSKINMKKTTPKHIINALLTSPDEDKNLKGSVRERKKENTGNKNKENRNLLSETMQTRRHGTISSRTERGEKNPLPTWN